MGVRSKIKKRLPIFGRRFSAPPQEPPKQDAPVSKVFVPEEPKSARGDTPVEEFIRSFIQDNKVVLFMKGTPQQPLCGFSANAAGILSSYGHQFAHFDVISDSDVRQGIKDFSEWPTIPQIYLGGEFVGGSDILSQMHQAGDLAKEMVQLFGES